MALPPKAETRVIKKGPNPGRRPRHVKGRATPRPGSLTTLLFMNTSEAWQTLTHFSEFSGFIVLHSPANRFVPPNFSLRCFFFAQNSLIHQNLPAISFSLGPALSLCKSHQIPFRCLATLLSTFTPPRSCHPLESFQRGGWLSGIKRYQSSGAIEVTTSDVVIFSPTGIALCVPL